MFNLRRLTLYMLMSMLSLPACSASPNPMASASVPGAAEQVRPSPQELQEAVRQAEIAFAKTMADRDFKAFQSFISDEAIFFSDQHTVLRGKAQIAAEWKGLYEAPQAPFSWAPERVEVLESGTLALSTGPIFDRKGKKIAIFNSIWRLDKDGQWQVVFDKGSPLNEKDKP